MTIVAEGVTDRTICPGDTCRCGQTIDEGERIMERKKMGEREPAEELAGTRRAAVSVDERATRRRSSKTWVALALPAVVLLIAVPVLLGGDDDQPPPGSRGRAGDDSVKSAAQSQEPPSPAGAAPAGATTTVAGGAPHNPPTTTAAGGTAVGPTTGTTGGAPAGATTVPGPGPAGSGSSGPTIAEGSRQVTELSGSAPSWTQFSLDQQATSFTVAWDMKGSDTNSVNLADQPENRNPIEVVTTTGPTKGKKTYPPGAGAYLLSVDGRKEWKVTVIQHFG